ncbi:hypothetical protein CVU82_00945 [Candidatus Falkowbacteria bacterium HGW-Falkowbacteria-1]|jgi:prepilin-type N-terminal cleavage/methylation domain-containing protein|uniref:General secretion pathway GspH domain-containing protein n=1 Tax=Candidatus Falkowbacteria bacterium HGW-Falkowbacteria-1 TaxID=2013768 RepID=A0A2N2EAP2_9BACT|nr:MAG: hypothetical protein CVU82_00945 [Candidatus Falkowbacteria bacterium HGW-Falkowbacteria-1]
MIFSKNSRHKEGLLRESKTFSRGFSLLEILLTVSILALLAGVLSPVYFSMQSRDSLEAKTETVVSSLRRAQILSMTGENDSSWGLKILENEVVVFEGNDYLTRDTVYDDIIKIDSKIITSGLDEIVFNKIVGDTNDTGVVTLKSTTQERNIDINKKGIVNY